MSANNQTGSLLSDSNIQNRVYSLKSTVAKSSDTISAKEYIIPVFLCISLIVACVIYASKTYFWNDELFSYFFLADPSFSHMWAAFHDKLNNTPPLYFMLGWGWSQLFGASELSLKLFSCLGIGIAGIITWVTLRRTYGFWATSLSVLAVFCLSDMVISQNAEARMYGLYLALSAAGIWLYDEINCREQLGWKILLINALVQAALVNTHLHGCFFSGAILAAFMVNDYFHKRARVKLYASFILGWLTFLFYIPALLIQMDAGNPDSWIPIPKVRYLLDVLSLSTVSTRYFPGALVLLPKTAFFFIMAILPGFYIFKNQPRLSGNIKFKEQQDLQTQSAKSLLILAYLFLAVPIGVWVFSWVIKPIFWDRYVLPTVLAWPILFASLLTLLKVEFVRYAQTLKNSQLYEFIPSRKTAIGAAGILVLMLAMPVVEAIQAPAGELPGQYDKKIGYAHLPVVIPFPHDFMERMHYSPDKERYFTLLDWEVALDTTSGHMAPQFYKHLEAWKRSYPDIFANQITTTEDFLSKHKQFLVLGFAMDEPCKCSRPKTVYNGFCDRWMYMRVVGNPLYNVRALGDNGGHRYFLVEAKQ
ncbi:hypothetical protein GXP67_06255 [Rhodocytophaga rosea]|uniref:Glycosyltransferase RgtA/B/C/D-like domain-containing protein n=1 Tax=Rhodocytophaga rosea TaxID=2704465 RepID=A0A6C0GEB5_9BACT|nr:hypothetical protein [Rhodocytophaga rosea]QHT66288.1 hypothetical protein GXP67_06255 [Rhodocytophaga rosea]